MKRIICIGNRYLPEDAAGYLVYQHLIQRKLPKEVEVFDGGLAGLDLLRWVENMERVAFVDTISGFGAESEILLLKKEEISVLAGKNFDHASGLPYLLRVLPDTCDGQIPEVSLIGIEGIPDCDTVKKAALLALKVVMGLQERSA